MSARLLALLGLVLSLGVPAFLVVQKERVLRDGTAVLLELAPVDPRSLVQGDYMVLDYRVSRDAQPAAAGTKDGLLVLGLDARGVATFHRVHDEATALAPGEHLLRFRVRDRRGSARVRLGAEAFFFQEGHAGRYEEAKYGELRVDAKGGSVLVGLRGEDLRPLGTQAVR